MEEDFDASQGAVPALEQPYLETGNQKGHFYELSNCWIHMNSLSCLSVKQNNRIQSLSSA